MRILFACECVAGRAERGTRSGARRASECVECNEIAFLMVFIHRIVAARSASAPTVCQRSVRSLNCRQSHCVPTTINAKPDSIMCRDVLRALAASSEGATRVLPACAPIQRCTGRARALPNLSFTLGRGKDNSNRISGTENVAIKKE